VQNEVELTVEFPIVGDAQGDQATAFESIGQDYFGQASDAQIRLYGPFDGLGMFEFQQDVEVWQQAVHSPA